MPKKLREAYLNAWAVLGSAIITAIGGFVAARATTVSEADDLNVIGPRAAALSGDWAGTYEQSSAKGKSVSGRVSFNLKPKKRLIEGSGQMQETLPDGKTVTVHFKIRGGFLHDRFLRLEYENSDDSAVQFGSVIGEFAPDGRSISGTLVGFGAHTGEIVTGGIKMQK